MGAVRLPSVGFGPGRIAGMYGVFVLPYLAACRRRSDLRGLPQPIFLQPWLPVLMLAVCLLGPVSTIVFVIALGNGPVAMMVLCTAAGATGLGVVLQVAEIRRQRRSCQRDGQAQQLEPQRRENRHMQDVERTPANATSLGGPDWPTSHHQQPPPRQQAIQMGHEQQRRCIEPPVTEMEFGSRSAVLWSPLTSDNKCRQPMSVAAAGAPAALPRARYGALPYDNSVTMGLVAYNEALRAVHAHDAFSYNPIVQRAHVHVYVSDMQPEQLSPGWQIKVEQRFAEQGWCLLGAAVRRGSTCISFALGNLWWHRVASSRSAASSGAAANEVDVAVSAATDGSNGRETAALADGRPILSRVLQGETELLPEVPETRADMLGTPEELLTGLGMRSEDIFPGFFYTVQVIAEDGGRYRARYTWLQDGSWLREPLGLNGDLPQGGRTAPSVGNSAGPRTKALRGDVEPPSGVATDQPVSSRGHLSSNVAPQSSMCSQSAEPGKCHHLGFRGSSGTREENAHAGASQRWILRAPCVLMGVPGADGTRSRAQRYDCQVWLGLAAPEGADKVTTAPSCASTCGQAPSIDPLKNCDIVFRVQPLSWSFEASELRVRQVPVQANAGTTLRPDPGSRSDIGYISGSASNVSHGDEGGDHGRTWSLMVWDEPSPAVADLPPVALPHRRLGRDVGDGEVAGNDEHMRTGAATCLVDLSVWCGEELLATRAMLLVPSHGALDGRINGFENGGGTKRKQCIHHNDNRRRHWPLQLEDLLHLYSAEDAQHLVVDLGLFLSGALDCMAQPMPAVRFGRDVAAEAVAKPQPVTGPGIAWTGPSSVGLRTGGGAAIRGQQLVLLLDLGAGLLSLMLRHGCCTLAELVWSSLRRLGFGAEEVLLHGTGGRESLPLLHAAIVSGDPQAAALVLSWYAAGSLPEPWLQLTRTPGWPAVLTPLALASAASPSGSMLLYILRNHPQSLAAWRVCVNGASGRSVAAAAGLWAVVLEADLRTLIAPVVAFLAAVRQRLALGWLSCFASLWGLRLARSQPETWRSPCSPGDGGSSASASDGLSDSYGKSALSTANMTAMMPAVAAAAGKDGAASSRVLAGPTELNMFVAQRTRTQMVAFHVSVVLYQLLAQLKALVCSFDAICPAAATAAGAAGPNSWGWFLVAHATGRCVTGRLWWTALEAALMAVIASPLGLRHHVACCAAAGAMRCLFQGAEGALLPPSEMSATGHQMTLAHVLFVIVTSCCYQVILACCVLRGFERHNSYHIFSSGIIGKWLRREPMRGYEWALQS
ncbi:hypothetical protein Vretifemale_2127 [Volvox reticuliferus]|nr:hypothetical protein Vretifemale_2127 [Volvox reticuliferus]